MSRQRKWKSNSGGGRLVVATDTKVWVASDSPKSPSSFTPVPREVLPASPIRCVATDGKHLAVAGGGKWNPEWELHEGDCTVAVIDLDGFAPVVSRPVEALGDHLGIAAGHVIDWYWYAQSDLLGFHVPVAIDGGDARIDADLLDEYFDYCGEFNACGEVVAGTIDYRNTLYLGVPGSEPRGIPVPEPFRNPQGFAFIGFDRDRRLVLTVRGLGEYLGGDEHHAWRLEDDDTWTDLGTWTVAGGYEAVLAGRVVEFAGADGRPQRLSESDLPD
jgi:hypothetical protein